MRHEVDIEASDVSHAQIRERCEAAESWVDRLQKQIARIQVTPIRRLPFVASRFHFYRYGN